MRLSKARKEIVNAVMKDTIVEAAGSVLEQHGVGGMTMDRVATSAGLTAGSLYNYFRNKDDLVQFIYERLVEPFFHMLEEIAATEMPAPKKLEKIVRAGLEHANRDRAIIRLLLDSGRESEIRSKAQSACDGYLREDIRSRNQRGLVSPSQSREYGPHVPWLLCGAVRYAHRGRVE